MDRSDILLMGMGGAGNKITDMIININPLFQGFFINTSKTDMENLDNFNPKLKNYICTSLSNGTGRDRELGKLYAQNKGWLMVKTIIDSDQSTIFIIFGLGGGSGSSSASILLSALDKLKASGEEIDKTINIIGILPDLDSPTIILQNTLKTWNEIMNYNCINNMLFIDNNNMINGKVLSEEEINKKFALLFDKIFNIPDINGTKFDNGNLGNIINSKGYTYIYDLPSGCENIEQAIQESDKKSILAKIYTTKEMIKVDENGNKKIRCGYLGVSLHDDNYTNENFLKRYEFSEENYYGFNEENNLLILTGMLPPYYSIQLINEELSDREKSKENQTTDFSKFTTAVNSTDIKSRNNIKKQKTTINSEDKNISSNKKMKRIMKKDLFDMF